MSFNPSSIGIYLDFAHNQIAVFQEEAGSSDSESLERGSSFCIE